MVKLQLKGTVLRAGLMQKTCTVRVPKIRFHPLAGKEYTRHKNYLVHDPEQQGKIGDLVVIEQCRPMSRHKHFLLHTILQRAQQYVPPTQEELEAAARGEELKTGGESSV